MMSFNMKTNLLALGIILYAGSGIAQAQRLDPATLGTSVKSAGVFNTDLAVAVRGALPSYDDKTLSVMFETIAKKYPNGFDPLKVDLDAIETLYGIKATAEGETQEREFSYQISKKSGRIYLHRERATFKPYSLEQGQRELRLAAQLHPALLGMFGIDKSQLNSTNSNLILLEGIQKLPSGGFGRPTKALVDNVFTYGQRSLEGIMVDGSYFKVISKDAKTNEGLVINWPRFRVHPELRSFDVKSKNEVLTEALEHLKLVANPRNESNIKMAVVFRPVMVGEEKVYVPAVKIGLYSRPVGVAQADEKGENGDLFFVDLMKQRLSYSDGELKDSQAGKKL